MLYQKQWQFLKKTAELGKVPHAYLFYGEAIEKKSLALEFVKLLNCENKNFNARPCQICRSCQDIEKKIHPDLALIEPENNEIKINQIRELRSRFALRSYSACFKSAIIDQAHCLNQEAQSASLKLLEEPKGDALFILITEYPEMLLPTILSRVERMRFYSAPKKYQNFDYSKKIITEILEIRHQDLATRFEYAKKIAEEPQNLKERLDVWLGYFREVLIATINNQSKDYSLEGSRASASLPSLYLSPAPGSPG